MNMIFRMALSKLRYHKSRTLLTGIAIMLTTMLLMAIGTSGFAMLDMNRQLDSYLSCQNIFKWNL